MDKKDKKVIESLWVKIVAVMVFVVSVVVFAYAAVGTVMLDEFDITGRAKTDITKYLYDLKGKNTAWQILSDISDNDVLDREYPSDGFGYKIIKTDDTLSIGELSSGSYAASDVVADTLGGGEVTGYVFGEEDWEYDVYEQDMPYRDGFCNVYTGDEEGPIHYEGAQSRLDDKATKYYVAYSIDYTVGEGTMFEEAAACASYLSVNARYGVVLMAVSLLIGIAAFVFLMASAKSTMTFDNKIPYLILAGLITLAECVLLFIIGSLFSLAYYFTSFGMLILLFTGIGALLFAYFAMNTVTRLKARSFMRYTLFYYLCIPFRSFMKGVNENTTLVVKAVIFSAIVGVIQLLGLAVVSAESDAGLFLFVIYKAIEVSVIVWFALQFDRVKKGMAMVAAGHTDAPIDTAHMLPAFKSHAADIANVSDGINKAVEERMKSERMKTELITNVSHDIKTPLTSIINYVDLMEKHGTDDPEMQEYLEVLDRQSDRLKKLIEDLIEASKASSGAIEMNIEPVNVGVLLSQATGEFEEKLKQKELNNVVTVPEEELTIRADGRYLWRVIDNLMSNICKYAMPNTRVYVDLISKGDTAEISFKNISATELNITAEELTERFVRGDKSRNTEGSGLGLSIAKSLTEHMGGTMDIHIDGDLFKVTLSFPVV